MPDNVQIGLLIIGSVLLLLGFAGGNIKIFGAEVANQVGKSVRISSVIAGGILLSIAVVDPFGKNDGSVVVAQ